VQDATATSLNLAFSCHGPNSSSDKLVPNDKEGSSCGLVDMDGQNGQLFSELCIAAQTPAVKAVCCGAAPMPMPAPAPAPAPIVVPPMMMMGMMMGPKAPMGKESSCLPTRGEQGTKC
jgi:hypothetical protein